MSIPITVYLQENAVVILDQTLLPNTEREVRLTNLTEVYDAIKTLQVRGAPAIGITAAMGLYVHMLNCKNKHASITDFSAEFYSSVKILSGARPTAVNLSWALKKMLKSFENDANASIESILRSLQATAEKILENDIAACKQIGEYGADLLKPGMGVLTHCNAGALAAAKYGTALAPIYVARERDVHVRVYADETRPVLQGARLTAYELHRSGVDVTLICDNMAAYVMSKGLVDIVFVGCDRVSENGDTANKIGTYGVAVLAKTFGVPFYVCAPFSTIDKTTKTGKEIEIEERCGSEITHMWYQQNMAPESIKTLNPAFDVTPAEYITGFITEKGILKPSSLQDLPA